MLLEILPMHSYTFSLGLRGLEKWEKEQINWELKIIL